MANVPNLSQALIQNRARQDNVTAMGVQHYEVGGTILVVGSGEVTVDVPFPVWFTEKPLFTFGSEMDVNQFPVSGNFPQVTGTILRWNIQKPGGGIYYAGGTLGIVSLGEPTQKVWFHWLMRGKAFRNPIRNDGV